MNNACERTARILMVFLDLKRLTPQFRFNGTSLSAPPILGYDRNPSIIPVTQAEAPGRAAAKIKPGSPTPIAKWDCPEYLRPSYRVYEVLSINPTLLQ